MNHIYRDLIFNLAKKCVLDATSVARLTHNGLKGQIRELFIAELLRPMLPKGYVIGTGNVITAYNQISNQIDVVVCDEEIVPPVLFQSSVGVFPFESVLISVEVKSRLDARELSSSHEAARQINSYLHCVPPTTHIENPITCLFAFDTDLSPSGKSEIERYMELVGTDEPEIRMICVVNRGCWHRADGRWHNWDLEGEYGEIVAFMMALTNRIQSLKLSRRRPSMRDYVEFAHDEDAG